MLQISVVNLVFTIVNLLVLVFIVWKFLLKPIRSIIEQRQMEAEEEIKNAEQIRQGADKLKEKYEQALEDIAEQKAEVLKNSRIQAAEDYDKIIAKANAESERIIREARNQAEEETIRKERQAKRDLADVVIDATNIIAGSHQDENVDRALYDEFIAKLGEK